MKSSLTVAAGLLGLGLIALGNQSGATLALDTAETDRPIPIAVVDRTSAELPAATLNDVVRQYCVICHTNAGGIVPPQGLSLLDFDVIRAADKPEVAEKMIRKLRAGMMPPLPMPRPGGDTLTILVETLERTMDQ